jgi:putative transposase
VKHRIDELYTESPFYGSRRLTACLKREGQLVNRKQVQRHRREMGIEGIAPKPNLSRALPGQQVFPYLLKGLLIDKPNQVWGIEEIYLKDYRVVADAERGLANYFDFYNRER